MAKVLISDQYLEDIADSIRDRLSVSTTYTPAQMAAAISSFAEDANASANDILNGKTAYVGNQKITGNIESKTSANLMVSGPTLSVPAGYYATTASASVAAGSASTPATTITATPSISISESGKITASVSASKSITPDIIDGYITTGTSGTVSVAGSAEQQLATKAAATYNVSSADQEIAAGSYLTGKQIIKAVSTTGINATNVKAGVVIKVGDANDDDRITGITGTFTSASTVSNGQTAANTSVIRSGYSAWVDGVEVKGSLGNTSVIQGSTTIVNGTVTRGNATWGSGVISSGSINAATFANSSTTGVTYIDISDTTEAPVLVSGDALYINKGYTDNLKISLAKLVPDGASANLASNKILSGYSAYNSDGTLIAGNIASVSGGTFYAGASNITAVLGNRYITNDIKIGAVTATNLNAANIKSGTTIKIGDVADDDRIANITGTFTSASTVSSGQTAAAAGQILSGYSAWVNGTEVKGNIASKSVSNLEVSGATVTAPAGYYASNASTSVAAGSVSVSGTGSATIDLLSYVYDSSSNKFNITGSESINGSVTATVTAGYVNSNASGSISGIANVSTTVSKIAGTTEFSGTTKVTPVISRTNTTATGATNVGSGNATTTKPTSGYFVSVKSDVKTSTLTATPSITTDGYGTSTNHGIIANSTSVGANESSVTYITVPGGSVAVPTTAINVTPTINVGTDGKITATVNSSQLISPEISAGYVTSGTSGTITAEGSATQQMTVKVATTYAASAAEQSITAGTYITGKQTILAVSTTGINASTVKSGVVAKVGDSGDDDRLIGVTGTFTDADTVSSGQTAAAAGQILSGYSAWVDGAEVKGNIATKTAANMTVSGATVTAPAGFYATNSSTSVAAGSISVAGTGSATVNSLSYSYDSTSEKFNVSGSKAISGSTTATVTSGYISSNTSGSVSGTASVSTTVNKIAGSTTISGTTTKKPSIARTTTTASGATNVGSGSASTTKPSSGYFVSVQSAANTGTLTATPTVTGAGYGTADYHSLAGSSIIVGAAASDEAYITVPGGSASIPATTITTAPSISIDASGLITASYSGSKDITPTVSAGYVTSGTAGTVSTNGSNTKQMTTKAATTYNVSTSDQEIAATTYLTGKQTFRAVSTTGISAANVKHGVAVKVGDAGDDDRIVGVTGTFTSASTVSSGQTAAAAGQIRSGYSAWVNGAEVKGSIGNTSVSQGNTTVSGTTASRGVASWGTGYITAGSIGAAEFSNSSTTGTTYVDISGTTDAPVLVSGDYLYINKGYVDNVKISLAKLVPDGASAGLASGHILSGYSAYNSDGTLIAGNIATKTAANMTVSGATVTAPAGYYATASSTSVAAGSVSVAASGSATVDTLTYTYNSTSGKFTISGSKAISGSATATVTAGYISGNASGSTSGTASVNTTVNKITGSTSFSGSTTQKPVISRTTTTASGATNVGSGDATTTKPTSGYFVSVQTAAKTGTLTATPAVTGAGYGTADYHGIAASSTAVGASASDETYITVPGGSASTPATTITANPSITVSDGGLITASYSGSKSITPTVNAGYVAAGTAGTVSTSGSNTKQLTTKAATTYNISSSDQTIAAGTYLTGTQTIKAVSTTGIAAANVKSGIVIKVGDANSTTRISNVTGTFTSASTVSSGQTAAAAGQILSGYSAWVDGAEVKGNIASKSSANMTVSGATVTAPAGYYASSASTSVVAGSVSVSGAGSATISSLSYTYNSTTGNFAVSGSASISGSATATVSAGYISSGANKALTGSASVSTSVAKIAGSTTISGTTTKKPVIARTTTTASGATNVGSGDASTSAPSSGYFVSVQSAANTGTLTATPSVSTAGYGTSANHGISAGSATVGASASDITYVTVPGGSASTPATTITVAPSISIDSAGKITASNSGSQSVTPTVSAGYVTSGTAGTVSVNGSNTKQMTTKAATTYNVSTSDQTIASGTYLTGTQTFRAVSTTGIAAANVKSGIVIKVGDAGSTTRISNVTGTFTSASTVSSGQTAASASVIRSGYSAWVDGAEVKGSMGNVSFANTATSGVSYTDVSESAPVLVSGDYLYVNTGYTGNVKMSLAKLVPNGASAGLAAGHILSGYSAYNNDGTLIAGSIATKTSSNVSHSGKTVTIPAGYYASQVTHDIDTGTVVASISSNTSGSASMAATGFTASSSATSFYVTLSTSAGSVKAKAVGGTSGYVTSSTTNETSATSVAVSGNGNKLYIPAGSVTTSLTADGMSTYFNSGTSSDKNVTLTPKYTNTAGYKAAVTTATNNGGTAYYKIKTASPTFSAAPTGGSTASSSAASISTSTNNSGITIQTAYSINAATISYSAAATGWIDKAASASTGSSTTAKGSTNGTAYYLNGVTISTPSSGNRTFTVTAPSGGTNHTYTFTQTAAGRTNIGVDSTLTMQWNDTTQALDFVFAA